MIHFSEQLMWLLIAIFILIFLLLFLRESRIFEPVHAAHQIDWKQYQFAAGDLVLFSGMGWLGRVGEATLKLMGRSPYTHVGMIYIDPNPEKQRDIYVWEMHNATLGTRLTPIQKVMERYKGRLVVRPLYGPDNQRGVDDIKLRSFIRSRWGLDYAYDFWFFNYNRYVPSLPMPACNGGQHRPFRFCSDLISETLYAVGVLDYSHNPDKLHEAIPRDFAQATQAVPMAEGWKWGPEILMLGTRTLPLKISS